MSNLPLNLLIYYQKSIKFCIPPWVHGFCVSYYKLYTSLDPNAFQKVSNLSLNLLPNLLPEIYKILYSSFGNLITHITINQDDDWKIWAIPDDRKTTSKPKTIFFPTQIPIQHIIEKSPFYLGRLKEHIAPYFYQNFHKEMFTSSNFYLVVLGASVIVVFSKSSGQDLALALFNRILEIISDIFTTLQKAF